MRPGQNKRMRGRNPNNNSSNNGGNRKGPNPLTRSYESNGPDVKIRGNAHHVAEKYLQLARDAQSSGDPVAAESYLQHAEHYFRLIASAQQAQMGHSRPPEEVDDNADDDDSGIPDRFASPQPAAPFVPTPPPPAPQPYQADRQPYAGDRQPYAERQNNGSGERQPYADRQNFNGDRQSPPSQDRNGYDRSQRQDRNGMGRNRPYRENGDRGPDLRNGDRSAEGRSGDRLPEGRSGDRLPEGRSGEPAERQDRTRYQDRPRHERGNYDRSLQDRPYRDPASEQPRDAVSVEQPRLDNAERPPEPVTATARAETPPRAETPRAEVTPHAETAARVEPAAREAVPRGEERSAPPVDAPPRPAVARVATAPDDGPGLPSFITTPTRVAPAEVAPEPNLAGPSAFPGDDAVEAPKFPRRRRRTTRAAAGESAEPASEGPVTND